MNLPEGWKLVPVEPTGEMLEAGAVMSEKGFIWGSIHPNDFPKIFKAMLAAAPTPPLQEDEPIYQWWDGECWIDVKKEQCELAEARGANYIRKVYLHPADDKLRKAAEEAAAYMSYDVNMPERGKKILTNLRAALERKPTLSSTDKPSPG